MALAGLKAYAERGALSDGSLIAVNSGANLNFDRLRTIADRAEVGEHREALLAVTVPEKPGSYRHFIRILAPAPSPSSTTALPRPPRRRSFSSASR